MNSADATVVLYTKDGKELGAHRVVGPRTTASAAGRRDHHEGDKRSPVGVSTRSATRAVCSRTPAPGCRTPESAAFAAPRYWPKSHWHDFDYVIAIDYNRVKGTSRSTRPGPRGSPRAGRIWLHMDHGSGTSACVSLPKSGMQYLLRDPRPGAAPGGGHGGQGAPGRLSPERTGAASHAAQQGEART